MDQPETNTPMGPEEAALSNRGLDKIISEAMLAGDQGRMPADLLIRLTRFEEETLRCCIRRLADPNLGEPEGASLVRLLDRAGLVQKMMDNLLTADRQSATAVAAVLQRQSRGLDLKLASHLQSDDPAIVMRSLELLEVIGQSKQLVPVLYSLLSRDDPKIQSKASLVVQKMDKEFVYTQKLLRHSDARVRANALEAIAGQADARALEFLRHGAEDPDHRVRSLAAVGLCRIGDALGMQILSRMIRNPSVLERRSAAWALGTCGGLEDLPRLESAANNDRDQRVRELAAEGIRKIRARAAEKDANIKHSDVQG